jgi:hypothetical protein
MRDSGVWQERAQGTLPVIPGRREAADPESIFRSAGIMDSGFAA